MEMVMTNGFAELSANELHEIDGGVLALTTVLFTIGKISVTVGMCLKAGAVVGLTAGGAVVLSK